MHLVSLLIQTLALVLMVRVFFTAVLARRVNIFSDGVYVGLRVRHEDALPPNPLIQHK